MLAPSAVRAKAMSGPCRLKVSIDTYRPSNGHSRTVAVALSMLAMRTDVAAASGAASGVASALPLVLAFSGAVVLPDAARANGGVKPAGLSITKRSAVTATPGTHRCQPSSSGCGHRQSTPRFPSMAKCRPVASLTLSLIHGLARFQSINATASASNNTSATSTPTNHSAHRPTRRRPVGLVRWGEGSTGGVAPEGMLETEGMSMQWLRMVKAVHRMGGTVGE